MKLNFHEKKIITAIFSVFLCYNLIFLLSFQLVLFNKSLSQKLTLQLMVKTSSVDDFYYLDCISSHLWLDSFFNLWLKCDWLMDAVDW